MTEVPDYNNNINLVKKIVKTTYLDITARESPTFAQYTFFGVTRRTTAHEPDLSLTDTKFRFINSSSPARQPARSADSRSVGKSGCEAIKL